MIDGVGSAPFSAETIPPIETPSISYRDDVIENSRAQFSRPRAEIEEVVRKRQTEFVPPPPKPKARKEYGPPSSPRRADTNVRNDSPRDRAYGNDAPRRYPPRDDHPPRPAPTHVSAPNYVQSNPRVIVETRTVAPQSVSKGAENRSALRAALQQATREAAPHTPAMRSPAEIMRERMTPGGNENVRGGEAKPHPIAHVRKPEEKPYVSTPNVKDGEVSPDVLREVLRGNEDSDRK